MATAPVMAVAKAEVTDPAMAIPTVMATESA